MKTVPKILSASTLVLGLACGGGGHGHHHHGHGSSAAPKEITLQPEVITQHGIEVKAVGRRTLRPTFTAPARVTFDEETMAHVGTLVKGRVAEMKAHLGERVQAGQLLFAIDSPELGAAQNQFLQALDAAAATEPAVALAEHDPGLAKAAAEVKAAEAMLALVAALLPQPRRWQRSRGHAACFWPRRLLELSVLPEVRQQYSQPGLDSPMWCRLRH